MINCLDKDTPFHKDNCICDHFIYENCYAVDKRDKNIVDFDDTADNTTNDLNEAALMPPLPIESGKTYRWDEKRSTGAHKGIDIPAKNGTPIKSIADGKVIAEAPVPNLSAADLEAAMVGFRGPIEQVPSMFSALKVNGQPLTSSPIKALKLSVNPAQ